MIQIYKPTNIDFSKNGDMTLLPELATVKAVLNGGWEVEMNHPIDDDGRWKYIKDESVIKMQSFNGEQLFRIKSKLKTEDGIEVTAVPIFLDARDDCFIEDIRPTSKNGQQALDLITAPNSKYTGVSDIKGVSTAYYEYMNLIEAINGENVNSFINRWGGEMLYDNHRVIINKRVGSDYGVNILYGKNIQEDGIEEEIDFRDVVTRIYPKSYNGHKMTGKSYIDSPLINAYPTIKSRTITFADVKMREDAQEGDVESGVIICDNQSQLNTALKQRCEEQYKNGIDKPHVSISVDIVMLQNTDEYAAYKDLETVSLGDTVHCEHDKLGIKTDARVVELEYDSILKVVTRVTIGDFVYNYFADVDSSINRIDKAIRPDGSIVAEEIRGLIDAMNASLRLQSSAAKKVDGRAFLIEDLDSNSELYGAMEAGTQGLRISKKRAVDKRSWVWTTAITALGIIADAIVTGSITSTNWIKDLAGFRLNLDDGTINSKHLKLDQVGLLTLYKALITGGEITITDKAGKVIFKVSEDGGLSVGDGSLSYSLVDKVLKVYKALITGGEITINDKAGNRIFHVDETGTIIGLEGKSLKYNADSGVLEIFKALITGGEITIKDKNGNRIFRVSENEGFIFGDGENGTIRYDISDRILKLYRDIRLYGRIDNYSETGKKSVSIGNNSIEIYSWATEGDFIGALGSEVGNSGDGANAISLACDTNDQITLAYFTSETTPDGKKRISHFMRFDPQQIGNDPLDYNLERAIKMAEVPRISGAWNGTISIGPLVIKYRSGIVMQVNSEGGVWSGRFKTGASEDVNVMRGAITSVG